MPHKERFVPKIVLRHHWGSIRWKDDLKDLTLPISTIVVKYDSKTEACSNSEECRNNLRNLQKHQVYIKSYEDIEYNFYIGGDGFVYEGTGWTKRARKSHDLSGTCIDVAYMGSYGPDNEPPPDLVQSLHDLIEIGQKNDFITPEFKIIEHKLKEQNT